MKHTHGPWTAHDDGLVTAGPRGLHIAQTATVGMGHAAAANARLIAAAPDLLLALRALDDARGHTWHKPAGQKGYDAVVIPRETFDRALSILAALDTP